MPVFTHIITLQGAAKAEDEGNIVDIALLETTEHRWAYAASRDGALSAWDMGGNDAATLIGRVAPSANAARQNLTRLEILDSAAGPQVLTGGVFGHDMSALSINMDTGAIGARRITLSGDEGGYVSATVSMGGQDYLYTADRGSNSIARYRLADDLDLVRRGDIDAAGAVSALASVEIGSSSFLLVAESDGQTLSSHSIRSDGRSDLADTLSAEEGLAFRYPSALAIAELDGAQYIILAAARTSSLSVIRVGSTGSLTATDRVFDTRGTRFEKVAALEVVTRGDDVFVLAGGADDGVSLFAVLPGGRLHHLAQIADTVLTSLANVQTLTGFATPEGLTVLAGSESEGGITQLSVSLDGYGGPRRSATGEVSLRGSAADDILIAGDGAVRLTGGDGRDTFMFDPAVATQDGGLGRILDFDPDLDRIDLSLVLQLYRLDRVDLHGGTSRATLELGPYTLEVTAASGVALEMSDFTVETMSLADRPTIDPWNHPILQSPPPEPDPDPTPDPEPEPETEPVLPPDPRPVPPPEPETEPEHEPGITLNGTDDADILFGSDHDDFIFGFASNDHLYGNDGNDLVDGGDGADFIDGRNDDDTIRGGDGNDELRGGAGNDAIAGGAGADFIIGNSGDDVLTGSGLSDLVFGGPGDDFVNGGWGYDRINGGPGADKFFHLGIFDHGSDWVQDYSATEGDVLFFGIGTATADDFRVNMVEKQNAGQAGVKEAFVVYTPTGQIMWALIDGAAQDALYLQIGGKDEVFDLLA